MGISTPGTVSDRALVAVIDSNPDQRALVAKSLTSFYRVADFPDLDAAAAGAAVQSPSVLVLDDRVTLRSGRPVVPALRKSPAFRDTRIVICTSRPVIVNRQDKAGRDEADAVLAKPFRRSDLINTISGLINDGVESAWNSLPAHQNATLRGALTTFNGIADLIECGEPLAYDTVVAACNPLIDAVAKSEHKVLLKNVRGHDNYGFVHSLRVATLLTLFGDTIGLKDDALLIMATGGLVHDIGKMSIPHEVLNKISALTPQEWTALRGHVNTTTRYLRELSNVPKGVLTLAAQHHEKLDGTGYPAGLKGSQLNDLARMGAIVDVFVAMTDRRSYKEPMDPETALATMADEMTRQLDQRLLKMFREMLLDATCVEWA